MQNIDHHQTKLHFNLSEVFLSERFQNNYKFKTCSYRNVSQKRLILISSKDKKKGIKIEDIYNPSKAQIQVQHKPQSLQQTTYTADITTKKSELHLTKIRGKKNIREQKHTKYQLFFLNPEKFQNLTLIFLKSNFPRRYTESAFVFTRINRKNHSLLKRNKSRVWWKKEWYLATENVHGVTS